MAQKPEGTLHAVAAGSPLFGSRSGGLSSFYPLIAGAIIITAGVILYAKRKWITSKIRKQ